MKYEILRYSDNYRTVEEVIVLDFNSFGDALKWVHAARKETGQNYSVVRAAIA